MTYEELKKVLNEIFNKKRLLKRKQEQLKEEKASVDGIMAVRYDKVNVVSSGGTSQAEKYAEHVESLNEEISKLLEETFNAEDYISEHLKELTPMEQSIITDRYMNGKSWRAIERDYYYSIGGRGAEKATQRALNKIVNI